MHRQSLGSPASKLHLHILQDESLASESHNLITEEKQHKTQKLNPKSPEKYIHLIPILTLFCFLILYLSSHKPSPNDLAQFKLFSKPTGNLEDVIEANLKIKNGDILAIRSLKNLEEKMTVNGSGTNRRHRKIGDF